MNTEVCFTSGLEQTSFSKSSISISEEFHGVVRFQVSDSQLRMSPVRKFLQPVMPIISWSDSSLLNTWASVTEPNMDIIFTPWSRWKQPCVKIEA